VVCSATGIVASIETGYMDGRDTASDWAHYYARPIFSGVELLHARFVRHAFARHAHEYFVVSVVERGVQRFWCDRETHTTPPLGIIVLNPGDAHTGEAAIDSGFLYRAVYPSAALLSAVADEVGGEGGVPQFSRPRIDDEALAWRLVEAHRLLIAGASALQGEEVLLETLIELVGRYADGSGRPRDTGHERQAVRRVREYIEARFDRDVTLTELAEVAGLSPFHMARVFRAEVGLPPHAYLESVRIREAQRLIRNGQPLVEVAHRVGFADQSHFTHRFRRMVGVTPGRYAGSYPTG
jgi:AraC-like DNA-binding protein